MFSIIMIKDSISQFKHQLFIGNGRCPIVCSLTDSKVSLGREDINMIQIDRSGISSRHLELHRLKDDSAYELVDLDSQNGTKVNGITASRCLLQDGDSIEIGREVTVHYLILGAGAENPEMDSPKPEEWMEFHTLRNRMDDLENELRILEQSIQRKSGEYESLIENIVGIKQDPVKAFRDIDGESEIYFPVQFGERAFEEDEIGLPS